MLACALPPLVLMANEELRREYMEGRNRLLGLVDQVRVRPCQSPSFTSARTCSSFCSAFLRVQPSAADTSPVQTRGGLPMLGANFRPLGEVPPARFRPEFRKAAELRGVRTGAVSTGRTGWTAELERTEYVDQRNDNTYWCPAVDSFTARVVTSKGNSCPGCGNRWALEGSEMTMHNLNAYNVPVCC